MLRAASVVLLIALSACSDGPSRDEVLRGLVGHTEADAIRTLGMPSRSLEANGRRFLGYDDVHTFYTPGPYFGPFGFVGFGYASAAYPTVAICQATLEIAGGRVAAYTLRGNDC